MKNNSQFIKLPSIRSIEVNYYALFTDSWAYKVKPGLNLFLGVNGLGKTTTANMIIYGIVGLWGDISESYFADREHPLLKEKFNHKEPSVIIIFDIGPQKVLVERLLHTPSIVRYSIEDIHYTYQTTENIDKQYQRDLASLCSVDSIEELSFLLTRLLIREEEGNYLLWDKIDQSKVIRLLLNASNFYRDFSVLEKEVTDADTGVRGQQDIQHKFKERQKHLIAQRDEVAKKGETLKTRSEILKRINELTESIGTFQGQKDRNLESLNYLNSELKSLERLTHSLSAEVDAINDEITSMEQTFFESIYFSPRISLMSHKLSNYNICILCNNKISHSKANQITNLIEHGHSCPVCESKLLPLPSKSKTPPKEIIEKLRQLRELSDEKSHQLHERSIKKSGIELSLSESWRTQREIDEKLNKMRLDLNDLNLNLSASEKGDVAISPYDRDINVLQEQIDYYQRIIDKHREKYDEKKAALDEKNTQLNTRIAEYSEKLNKIFNRYAKDYFKEDCVLVPYEGRKPTESKVKLTTYCPQFDGKLRTALNSVSKSEGIFLEYLFRMALVELYAAETSSPPFLILETSEGAFDIFRTDQLAEAIAHFGRNKFPFITIVNLSKPAFVANLIENLKNAKDRVFNFIDYGALDKEQEKHKKDFEKEIKKLHLWE
jgi:hypothetical protein